VSKRDAIRVIVGDGSRVDRDLVRFMLERDGFRVISSVAASEDLNRAASVMQPDAVVLGEELLDLGGGQAARIARGACPEAKIVLFSALPAAAAVGPGEPDAVLERGIGLKDLTQSLNDLFQPAAVGTVATLPLAAARARPSTGPAPASAPPPPVTDEPRRRPFLVLAAAAAAMILLVFVVARNFPSDEASVRTSSGPSTAPAIGSAGAAAAAGATATPSPTASATAEAPLSSALTTLGLITQAIRDGDAPEVLGLVRKLAAERAVAAAAGADVSLLNKLIGKELVPLTQGLEPRTAGALRNILGSVVPPPNTTGTDPSEPGPSNEEPRPDPTTSPPPADGTGDTTTTTPPTDSGTDPGNDGSSTEDPGTGAEPPTNEAQDQSDSNVGDDLTSDRDPDSSNVDSSQDRSNAPAADGGPAAEGDGGADDQGGEPDSDEPIASTGPSASTGGDRETTDGDDSPDDGDGDAAADGS
jgi:hypothetical protein